MKILVCIKQVPDSETAFKINDTTNWIQMNNDIVFRMNRFDEFAIEESLRIKEKLPDVNIDVISVGPPRVTSTIRKALGMGADNGIHILLEKELYHSPYEIASLIAFYARDKNYDLIFTGVMAEDDMQCQVGQLIAGILNIPSASSTILERINPDDNAIYVEREIDNGLRESLDLLLPALLTIQSGINHPRYPSLSNVLRAKDQELITVDSKSLPKIENRDRLTGIYYPQKIKNGLFIDGSPEEKAEKLLEILHDKSLI